jgi:hypothetical protein
MKLAWKEKPGEKVLISSRREKRKEIPFCGRFVRLIFSEKKLPHANFYDRFIMRGKTEKRCRTKILYVLVLA